MIARTTVRNVKYDEAATDDFQRNVGHYHKCLDEALGLEDHYARNLDGIEGFTNDDVPNLYETCEEA